LVYFLKSDRFGQFGLGHAVAPYYAKLSCQLEQFSLGVAVRVRVSQVLALNRWLS